MCVAYDLTSLQREAEHRESLATTIRVLRANESEQTLEIVCLSPVGKEQAKLMVF